jgi:hypothetical protein
MSHSHLGPRHLLAELESRRSQRGNKKIRPEWLDNLIEEAAASFEPLAGMARVGYQCEPEEGGWAVSLFLGAVERVGGKADGQTRQPEFRCDLKRLLERFERIDQLEWTVQPEHHGEQASPLESVIEIRGVLCGSPVSLSVLSNPLEGMKPGLREFPDGRVEPV